MPKIDRNLKSAKMLFWCKFGNLDHQLENLVSDCMDTITIKQLPKQ